MQEYFHVLVSGITRYIGTKDECWTYAKEHGYAHWDGYGWILYPDVAIKIYHT